LTTKGAKNISYRANSPQIGLLSISNAIQIDLEVGTLPLIYQSRVSCVLNGTKMISSVSTKDTFNCQIYATIDSVYMIGLTFNYPNLFEIENTTSVFHEKIIIEMKGNQLNKNDVVEVQLNTNQLISSNFLKNDCSDLIVTYDDKVIARQVTNCGSTSTLVKFKIEAAITQNSTRYSIYFSNPYQTTLNNVITGILMNLNYTLTPVNNMILALSSNELVYRGIPKLLIQVISPQISLLGTRNVSITSNLNLNNYDLLNFEISNGTQYYKAQRVTNTFSSYLTSQYSAIMNISIFAVYKKTNEKLLISDFVQFYFWSKVPLNLTVDSTTLTDVSPFIDKYDSNSKNQSKTVSIRSVGTILSDYQLFCRFIHKGYVSLSKASKTSSNSVACGLSVNNLSLNTELMYISLYLNQSNELIAITQKNLTYVFIKEPISMTGLPKTISTIHYLKNFTLNFDDVRKSEFVSFSNYTVDLLPEFYSKIELNCSYLTSPLCTIPSFQLNTVPVKLNLVLNVYSAYSQERVQIQIEDLYHKENVTIKQEFPYLIDLESYISTPVVVLFNSSKNLNSNYSYFCQCNQFIFNPKDDDVLSKAEIVQISNQFKCEIKSDLLKISRNVSLWIVNDTHSGLDGVISFSQISIPFSSKTLMFLNHFSN
jgi:hypothetical protein